MAKELTEKQKRFLEVLFDEAAGDYRTAMNLAGYSKETSIKEVTSALEEEIFEATKKFIVRSGVKAAFAIQDVMDNPIRSGNKERITAAKDILDRAGILKTERIEVKSDTPLFILPEKKND